MEAKRINKAKKSNRRCVNCVHWNRRTEAGRYDICPVAGGKRIHYWNCCEHFAWAADKLYIDKQEMQKK